jgi:hypothetical protein
MAQLVAFAAWNRVRIDALLLAVVRAHQAIAASTIIAATFEQP